MTDNLSETAPADRGAEQGIPDENLEESDAAILEIALARFKLAEEAESDMRKEAQDDLEFISGKQWPLSLQQERDLDLRPCLTVNRLPQQVQQVTNDQRQNRPSIKVAPVDSAATEELADLMSGLIRHIENQSNAETAYDTAGESAARGGFGYWRLLTDFSDPESFDQEVYIKRIRNPLCVFLDPYAQEPDGSDANWGFIIDDLSPEEFKARHPGSKLASTGDWSGLGNNAPGWIKADSARIAEYFYKEFKPARIHLLATGETVYDHELAPRQAAALAAGLNASVVKSRETKITVVKWLKITAVEVLEKTDWVGSFIPIIPVYGNELIVNGKRILESVIRHAKDPQRMLNYYKSAASETIALAPRTPWVLAEGQVEGYETIWGEANRKNHAYLPYKPTSIGGAQVPPPQRQNFEPATQAISQAAMGAGDDIKSTTGVYDSALGDQGNETAGVAINARSRQTQISNYHFFDNMKRSLRHTGRCLVEILPKVYDSARAARIIKEDGTQKVVRLNQAHKDPETGKDVLYTLSEGRYDVTIDTGPSYATRRQEASESMLEFTKAMPQTAQFIADLIARNQDWPGSQEMADRLKLALPPQLQNDGKQPQVPPQAMALLQQQHGIIGKLQADLSEATKVIETKQLEIQHKERVSVMHIQLEEKKIQADIEKTLAQLGSQSSIALLKEEIGVLKHESALLNDRLGQLGQNQPIEAPNDFNPNEADGGNYAGAGHIGGSPTGGANPPGQSVGVTP